MPFFFIVFIPAAPAIPDTARESTNTAVIINLLPGLPLTMLITLHRYI
jgi:hypothetical protein